MATPRLRGEYTDKTLAMNAMIDRQLKIKISSLDAESSIYRKELAREEKAIRQELNSSRRMSLNQTSKPRANFNRRASSPLRCRVEEARNDDISKSSLNMQRLELPEQKQQRRRSLPDMEKFSLPSLGGSQCLIAMRPCEADQRVTTTRLRYRQGRRRSENVGTISQLHTPSLSPRHSISSLVSSLSNSSTRLQNIKDSEETFDKVRQFLQKLDVNKEFSESQRSDESSSVASDEDFEKADGI